MSVGVCIINRNGIGIVYSRVRNSIPINAPVLNIGYT